MSTFQNLRRMIVYTVVLIFLASFAAASAFGQGQEVPPQPPIPLPARFLTLQDCGEGEPVMLFQSGWGSGDLKVACADKNGAGQLGQFAYVPTGFDFVGFQPAHDPENSIIGFARGRNSARIFRFGVQPGTFMSNEQRMSNKAVLGDVLDAVRHIPDWNAYEVYVRSFDEMARDRHILWSNGYVTNDQEIVDFSRLCFGCGTQTTDFRDRRWAASRSNQIWYTPVDIVGNRIGYWPALSDQVPNLVNAVAAGDTLYVVTAAQWQLPEGSQKLVLAAPGKIVAYPIGWSGALGDARILVSDSGIDWGTELVAYKGTVLFTRTVVNSDGSDYKGREIVRINSRGDVSVLVSIRDQGIEYPAPKSLRLLN